RYRRLDRDGIVSALLTAIAAVTVAWVGYTVGYLVL
ncbi:MAG: hypothetical protein ACI9PP_002189, partial [Halobacteriales archaeon]